MDNIDFFDNLTNNRYTSFITIVRISANFKGLLIARSQNAKQSLNIINKNKIS